MRNIIDAIKTLATRNITVLDFSQTGKNRINAAGYSLEEYVKNLFADSFDLSETEKLEHWSETFSYLGNDANPPDMMLKNGDAIEVKKIESRDAALALNSSYPKHTLSSSNPMISNACRAVENWTEKAIIYANGVETIEGVEFAPTRELGRINRVDPLGITYLRIRGMWHIENPWKVFSYVYQRNINSNFNFMCIINEQKWLSLNNREILFRISNLNIRNIKIQNPDNPAKL